MSWEEKVESAYLKLKRLVYVSNSELHTRKMLSEFEPNSSTKLMQLSAALEFEDNDYFDDLISEIGYLTLPKIRFARRERNKLFRNDHATGAEWKAVQFFSGPIELHVLSVLWTLEVGKQLDDDLGTQCYASRLSENQSPTSPLFRHYSSGYNDWLSEPFKVAKVLVEEGRNALIIKLDISEYFASLDSVLSPQLSQTTDGKSLCRILSLVHEAYAARLPGSAQNQPLPIGLVSSQVLANHYLSMFDDSVASEISPRFYGRYVDDMIFVIEVPDSDVASFTDADTAIGTILDRYFVNRNLFNRKRRQYTLSSSANLSINMEKSSAFLFSRGSSVSALDLIKSELAEDASEISYLPSREHDLSLQEPSLHLVSLTNPHTGWFDRSNVSSLRRQISVVLQRAAVLSRLGMSHSATGSFCRELCAIVGGAYSLLFVNLWERSLTFVHLYGSEDQALVLYKDIKKQIANAGQSNLDLKNSLELVLEVAWAMAEGLTIREADVETDFVNEIALSLRNQNLLRHIWVRSPLLNYSDYDGALIDLVEPQDYKVTVERISNSPRTIPFHEIYSFVELNHPFEDPVGLLDEAKKLYASQGIKPVAVKSRADDRTFKDVRRN